MHPRILKHLREELCAVTVGTFNTTLREWLATEWKTANIRAVFKKGGKSAPSNYRPVSLTSTAFKIMGKVIRDYVMEHVMRLGLLSRKQYGFITGRSTVYSPGWPTHSSSSQDRTGERQAQKSQTDTPVRLTGIIVKTYYPMNDLKFTV